MNGESYVCVTVTTVRPGRMLKSVAHKTLLLQGFTALNKNYFIYMFNQGKKLNHTSVYFAIVNHCFRFYVDFKIKFRVLHVTTRSASVGKEGH